MKEDTVCSCGLCVTADWEFSKVYGRSSQKDYTGRFRVSYNGEKQDLFQDCIQRANGENEKGTFNWVMKTMENLLNWQDRLPIINHMIEATYQYVGFDVEPIKRFYERYKWSKELNEEGIEIALHICK